MKGGEKTVVTRLRVLTIKPRDVKTASYRIEMKFVEPRITHAPYVHRAKR
jgi:hypothetical protein